MPRMPNFHILRLSFFLFECGVTHRKKCLKIASFLEKLILVFKTIFKGWNRSRFNLSNEKNDNGVHLLMHQEHAYITLRQQNDWPMTNLWLMSSKNRHLEHESDLSPQQSPLVKLQILPHTNVNLSAKTWK